MNFQRILLSFVFIASLYSLWEGWQREHNPPAPANHTQTGKEIAPSSASAVPELKSTIKNSAVVAATEVVSKSGETVVVKTDTLRVELNTQGGDITRVELLKHFDTDDKTKPFVIFQNDESHKYIAQTGLLGKEMPNHNSVFSVSQKQFAMEGNVSELVVPLIYRSSNGTKVTKSFKFIRNSYLIDVGYTVENSSKSGLETSAYYQLVRDDFVPGGASMFVPTYTGPAFYTSQDKFKKVEFSNIEKGKGTPPANADNGWAGMLQHYFVSAWLPKGNETREFYVKKLDSKFYSTGLIMPVAVIEPGKTSQWTVPLYVGPAHSKLDDIAEGLGLSVDYGFLTVIAKPIFWLLSFIHEWVSNWGIAIIILTVLIKLVFFPLSAASYRSMAKMRVVAPKLKRLQEQYAHDREKLNRAMMEMYKTEKINPLGGCLPILIQIPVFIALYWSILSSVEMRYAPFFGWITDLSKADPYYVLPIIMGLSMIIQTKLNPTPPDPLQAKMMQIMPIVFSVVFFFFPAGLVLYSIVNNVLSILQQWVITRRIESVTKGAHKY